MGRQLILDEGRVAVNGQAIDYKLLRMARRRHVHLVINDDGQLEIRAPWRFSISEAEKVVRQQASWIQNALAHAEAHRVKRRPLVSGIVLPLLDERLTLTTTVAKQQSLFEELPSTASIKAPVGAVKSQRGWIAREDERLHLHLHEPDAADRSRELLEAWFRREARRILPTRLAEIACHIGLYPTKVTIRAQRTIWGSCSAKGRISLNWRLVLVPGMIADYVLLHELCHLEHLNHSKAFWTRVGSMMPDYRHRRERLKRMQSTLPL